MKNGKTKKHSETGFSLIEVIISMIIILIGLLGLTMTYASAVRYNAGNNLRLQSLAILQQEVEQCRSAKFTSVFTDAVLIGGAKGVKNVTTAEGNRFRVETIIDDDPFTNDVQIDQTKTLKDITITVSGENQVQGWISAIPATVVVRRVRGN